MGKWLKRLGVLVAATAIVVTAALWFAAHQQQEAITSFERRLASAGANGQTEEPRLADVPTPVGRYLDWALPAGIEFTTVRLWQEGTLRTDTRSEQWMPFSATHFVAPRTIGFVWNARVSVFPMLHVRVRDALVGGIGSGLVTLMSAIPVSQDSGTPEMNSGSLHRYLAEAPWYPTALRPSERLTWTAIDHTRALATLRDRDTSVSLEFRFAESGAVSGIYTPGRWGSFEGGYRRVAWEGHFGDYTRHQGVAIPTSADVGWYVDGRWQPVWRGHIIDYMAESIAVDPSLWRRQ